MNNNFKIGDKVVIKDDITGEDIQKLRIDSSWINKIKGKQLIVRNVETDKFEDTTMGFIWESKWFRYYSVTPEELFYIEE